MEIFLDVAGCLEPEPLALLPGKFCEGQVQNMENAMTRKRFIYIMFMICKQEDAGRQAVLNVFLLSLMKAWEIVSA